MKQATDLIQLYRDFFLLITKAQQLLLEETIKGFLIDHEGYSLREAEEAIPINYGNLLNEIKEYADELQWYIDNHQNNLVNQAFALEKLIIYKKRSLLGLSTLKKDMETTPPERERKRQSLSILVNRFISLFNDLLMVTRDVVGNTPIAKQTDWINLYELNDINIENL